MGDILASIRRILDEDEKTTKTSSEGVLVLDPSMMVDERKGALDEQLAEPELPHPAPLPTATQTADERPATHTHEVETKPLETSIGTEDDNLDMAPAPMTVARDAPVPPMASTLVAPAAAAAAASSVGALMRKLTAERNAIISRGGVTIEDLVREEIRPLLKEWLDTHLPQVVERLVQAEIERVVGRTSG